MVPTDVLKHRVDIEPFVGTSSEGDNAYGPKRRRVRGWLNAKRTTVRTAEGVDIVATATLMLKPGVVVPDQSRVTKGNATYTVVEVVPVEDAIGPHSQLLILDAER